MKFNKTHILSITLLSSVVGFAYGMEPIEPQPTSEEMKKGHLVIEGGKGIQGTLHTTPAGYPTSDLTTEEIISRIQSRLGSRQETPITKEEQEAVQSYYREGSPFSAGERKQISEGRLPYFQRVHLEYLPEETSEEK